MSTENYETNGFQCLHFTLHLMDKLNISLRTEAERGEGGGGGERIRVLFGMKVTGVCSEAHISYGNLVISKLV